VPARPRPGRPGVRPRARAACGEARRRRRWRRCAPPYRRWCRGSRCAPPASPGGAAWVPPAPAFPARTSAPARC